MKPILIVQGGQYGSEAKGAIAAYLCKDRCVDFAVRTGATNAGHTAYYNGKPVVLQQLPVGFVNPSTRLVVGAGALIDPEILAREVKMLNEVTGVDIRPRLFIDRRAGLHLRTHADRSKASGRHHSMGATGKGCSEALIDRIRNRGTDEGRLFGDTPYANDYNVLDTELLLNRVLDEGAQLLLEGTQGQLLDLYLGPYPFTTHKQTGPAQWMLEAGLSPSLPTEIVSVMRTHPIRVAGNSGPLDQETSWPILARRVNHLREQNGLTPIVPPAAIDEFEDAVRRIVEEGQADVPYGSDGLDQHAWPAHKRYTHRVALSELNKLALGTLSAATVASLRQFFEMTTVTKKLRRVAFLSPDDVARSCRQMRPAWIAMTFMNYEFPQYWFKAPTLDEYLDSSVSRYVEWVERFTGGARVELLSFGPQDEHAFRLPMEAAYEAR